MASGNLLGTATRVKNYKKIGTAYWSLLKLNFSIRKSSLLCGILRRREKRTALENSRNSTDIHPLFAVSPLMPRDN